jgi:lysine 2,3-aminomutase
MATDRTLSTPRQLLAAGLIEEHELVQITEVAQSFGIGITPQVRRLIGVHETHDPIAAQFIPSIEEMNVSPEELSDPIGDASHSPLPGIVHRYPDRVLLKPLNVCAVYCRFCFRRETIGMGSPTLGESELDAALDYIASHPDIWEVILSGGDPFLLSARRLRKIMQRLNGIPHVGVVRFHTRIPVVKPELVDPDFLAALKIDKAVYVVLHINHVRELSEAAQSACARLIDAGFPMLSQTVLLKNINADSQSLRSLFRRLVELRIKPYYLHHADMAKGTGHFRVSIAQGQELMRALRGHISGLCQPTYVLDIPGGHGKVPIGPNYLTETGEGRFIVSDPLQKDHEYAG